MSKIRLSLLIIAFLALFASQSKATTGHSITNLNVRTKPSSPVVNKAVDTLTLSFNLTAQSGIDVNRIKIFFNNGTTAFPSNVSDFTITPNSSHPDTRASVTYKTEGVVFSQTSTKILVAYCLTSFNCTTPLATAFVQQRASSSPGSSGGTNSNGSTSNGTVSQVARIFYLDVSEVSNGETGVVSTEPKQFRLTVEHDKNYLDTVTEDNFNAATNPILSNLVIRSTNTYTGKVSKVTDQFDFSLDAASIESTGRTGFLVTKYISTSQIITHGQRLKFSVNLKENFFDKFGIKVDNESILKDHDIINIAPLTGTLGNITINPSSLSFSNIGTRKGISNYLSDSTTISATPNSLHTAANFISVDFFRLNSSKKKIKPKLSINSKEFLTISPSLSGSASVSSSSITVPVKLATKAKEKLLVKRGFNDSSKNKVLTIPLIVTTSDVNGLDLIFTGTLTSLVDSQFELATGASNGNPL